MITRRGLLSLALPAACAAAEPAPDVTLRIAETTLELAPGHSVRTLAYNGQVPAPLLRFTENRPVTVAVVNQSGAPELVHWHGFHIPPEADGAHEEGTPMVQAHDRRVYSFIPRPAGTRWFHAHAMAAHNLSRGTYTGQFGMVIVEPRSSPGAYDLEVPILLHEWGPFFSAEMQMDVEYRLFSINGKMLGAGEPIRVRPNTRVLFRLLNASATMPHRLSLAGHTMRVIALDGNAVPTPQTVPLVELAPGERADVLVEMSNPGVWILGEEDARQRQAGAGIVIEYAGSQGAPRWLARPAFTWDYTAFGGAPAAPSDAHAIPIVIEPRTDGNLWAINGKSYPATDPLVALPGAHNRLIIENRGPMAHPVHLHRHSLEILRYAGKPTSGLVKDVITVPPRQTVEAGFFAGQPGPSLFHCHHQFHMDFGFMALLRY